MDENEILERVRSLVDEEHELRSQVADGELSPADEQTRLQQIEVSLDQCWDLLRQRRARREAGQSPEAAGIRPGREVEGYLQ